MVAIFKCIFLNENAWISIKVSLTFVPKGPINNIPALVQIMAWRRSGDKPLSEPVMVSLPTHKCVTRPQSVKVRGLSYPALTRSISWLLMPWLLVSPGHQQLWYWLCKIGRSLSYMRKYFNNLCHTIVEEWQIVNICLCFCWKFSMWRVKAWVSNYFHIKLWDTINHSWEKDT